MTGTLAIGQAAMKPVAVASRAGVGLPSLTAKATPVSADQILLWSDADSASRKVSFSALLSTLGLSGLVDNRALRADGTGAVQSSGITIDDSANVTGVNDLTIGGNLTVNGTTTAVNTSTLEVDDPLIHMGDGNGADTVDLGWYGEYDNTGAEFCGLFRDATDGVFRLFTGLQSEPGTTVDTGGAGYALATLSIGALTTAGDALVGDTVSGSGSWGDHIVVGASGGDKCIMGNLSGTGVVYGSHTTGVNGWAAVTVAGSSIKLAPNAGTAVTVTASAMNLASGVELQVNGTQVVTARQTGWGAPTGTATKTTFATSTVTLEQLAERVKALIDDLTTHGLIGS